MIRDMPQAGPSRFRNRLVAAAALLSAAACVACVALWVSSFWTGAVVAWNVSGLAVVAHSERNLIGVRLYPHTRDVEISAPQFYPNPDYKKSSGLWDELRPLKSPPPGTMLNGKPFTFTYHQHLLPGVGLGYRKTEYPASDPTSIDYDLYVPHWIPSLAFAVLPAIWYFRLARIRGRIHRGCCIRCGYDLRATPNRCPECGTVSEVRPSVTA